MLKPTGQADQKVVSEQVRRSDAGRRADTRSVELKNRSETESMLNVDLVFRIANSPVVSQRMRIAAELAPEEKVKVKPEVAAEPVKVVEFQFEWDAQGFHLSSQVRAADAATSSTPSRRSWSQTERTRGFGWFRGGFETRQSPALDLMDGRARRAVFPAATRAAASPKKRSGKRYGAQHYIPGTSVRGSQQTPLT